MPETTQREIDSSKSWILDLDKRVGNDTGNTGAASDIRPGRLQVSRKKRPDLFAQIMQMTDDIFTSFGEDISNASTPPTDAANIAYEFYRLFGTSCVTGIATAGIMIPSTKPAIQSAGKRSTASMEIYGEYVSIFWKQAGDGASFAVDHDTLFRRCMASCMILFSYLTESSFNLRLKRTYTLTAPSDPLTLCLEVLR